MNLRICSLCILTLMAACKSGDDLDLGDAPQQSDAADARNSEAAAPIGDSKCPSTCAIAIVCVARCGGPVVTSGCCPCEGATIDQSKCAGDTGSQPPVKTEVGPADQGPPDDRTDDTGSTSGPLDSTSAEETAVDVGTPADTAPAEGLPVGAHQPCAEGKCQPGLTPIFFFGVAGPSGPRFCACEVPCATDRKVCPKGTECNDATDGPGPICKERN